MQAAANVLPVGAVPCLDEGTALAIKVSFALQPAGSQVHRADRLMSSDPANLHRGLHAVVFMRAHTAVWDQLQIAYRLKVINSVLCPYQYAQVPCKLHEHAQGRHLALYRCGTQAFLSTLVLLRCASRIVRTLQVGSVKVVSIQQR